MTFTKAKMTPNEEKMAEYRNAQIVNQASMIEYIAIMSDIDLPTEDTTDTTMTDTTIDEDSDEVTE